MYDILEPCYHDEVTRETATIKLKLPSSFRQLGETERPLAVRTRMFGRAWPLRAPVRDGIVPTWSQLLNSNTVPCTVSRLDCYYDFNLSSLLFVLVPVDCFVMLRCMIQGS